jgi:hypothetical protein
VVHAVRSPFIDGDVLIQFVGIVTVCPEVVAGLRFPRSRCQTSWYLYPGLIGYRSRSSHGGFRGLAVAQQVSGGDVGEFVVLDRHCTVDQHIFITLGPLDPPPFVTG